MSDAWEHTREVLSAGFDHCYAIHPAYGFLFSIGSLWFFLSTLRLIARAINAVLPASWRAEEAAK